MDIRLTNALQVASYLSDEGIFFTFTSPSSFIICLFTLTKPIFVRHLMSSLLVALLVCLWCHFWSTTRQHSFGDPSSSFCASKISDSGIVGSRSLARLFQSDPRSLNLSATRSHTRLLIGSSIFSWANGKGRQFHRSKLFENVLCPKFQ